MQNFKASPRFRVADNQIIYYFTILFFTYHLYTNEVLVRHCCKWAQYNGEMRAYKDILGIPVD